MAESTHIALPLKYRPMTFEDVVGQEHVVRTLRHAIESKRIANAYLFIGPRGIGKTTLSRIFAKALNCQSPNGVEPCGKCTNCTEITVGSSLDVVELDAASHNKVEDVKPIVEAVDFKPASSPFRIFIIDECHMLSNAAWNALLKTLEEPPPHVRFIFATTEGDKVLPTIISRCQRFDLRRIQTNDIVSRLDYICKKEQFEVDTDALLAIARGAEGGMRDALSTLDQLVAFRGNKVTESDALAVFGLVSRSELENLAGAILKGDVAGILKAIEAFDSAGKNMRRLAAELLRHFRNLVVVQALGAKAMSLEATEDQAKTLAEQAKGISPGRVFRICDQLVEMQDALKSVLSVRTLMEMSLIKASRIATTATIDELMKVIRELKGTGPLELKGTGPLELKGTDPLELKGTGPLKSINVDELKGTDPLKSVNVEVKPSAVASEPSKPALEPPKPALEPPKPALDNSRSAILEDTKINDILRAVPGAIITDIKQ